ncbi:hypothetical protein GLOTRDRAFT_36323, partial [Gloeophyllum trabeum ATCC 11539]
NSLQDMLCMLQELQKRKAAKTSTRSVAFQNQKKAIYADARKNAAAMVEEGVSYIEQCREQLKGLKAQESSYEKVFPDLMQTWKAHDETVRALLALYAPFFEDLSERRSEEINTASSMCECHAFLNEC